jgi:hypothetical protein
MMPISRDAPNGPEIVKNLVVVYAWTGELDRSFEAIPSSSSPSQTKPSKIALLLGKRAYNQARIGNPSSPFRYGKIRENRTSVIKFLSSGFSKCKPSRRGEGFDVPSRAGKADRSKCRKNFFAVLENCEFARR